MLGQLDLFAAPAIGFDAGFAAVRRRELAHGAWVDHVPSWVTGHAALFDQLELSWQTELRQMYERVVTTPRLLASVPQTGIVEAMRVAISERYGEPFVRTTAALYRDGNDSVAPHGDTTARDLLEALVATVSLGQPRRLRMRPTEGGASIHYDLGLGDLFVMGGTCQRTWRHSVPKTAQARGPRIAVMFRPAWAASYDD
ncbi:MAG: alpha-ketoglutarate-dependent dioxygenase AlkB [Kofleriaceae bacterium]